MKVKPKNFLLILAWMALLIARPADPQIIVNLHTFSALDPNTGGNIDGANPLAGFVLSGNTLYGTSQNGGISGNGNVFAIQTDGMGFTNLYSFSAGSESYPEVTNDDGALPYAGLILSGNRLYGAASTGGTNGSGTLFAINTDGSDFTNLYTFSAGYGAYPDFTNADGAFPNTALSISGNTLYGTVFYGGTNGSGTVFTIHTDGKDFALLHTFMILDFDAFTNYDGAYPYGVILSGDTLYGVADAGGTNGNGTLFSMDTNGNSFSVLHTFGAGSGVGLYPDNTNSDGAEANGMILSGDILYGMTLVGGSSGNGTIFAVATNGSGFTNLYTFSAGSGTVPDVTNSDGAGPDAELIISGNELFGTAAYGGGSGAGTVFAINTNGTDFTDLYSFSGGNDGASPECTLVLSNNVLYGAAPYAGYFGNGTVFSVSVGLVRVPPITVNGYGTNAVLSWPTNAIGFTLQSTTNQFSSSSWTNVLSEPTVNKANYFLTNSLAGPRRFFRLQSKSAPYGIYMGDFVGDANGGGFATMVLRNGQGVIVVGYDAVEDAGVFGANFFVPVSGEFTNETIDNGSASGTFTTNSVSGNFVDNLIGSTGTFNGTRKPDTGIQQANAGYYSGTFSGIVSGNAYAVLAADGTGYFYTSVTPTNNSGGFGTIDASNNVQATTVPEGVNVAGVLDPTNHIISGTFNLDGSQLGTFSVFLNTPQ
ncbi:MAG: choice-of-anchor tandem repeat GloVer-containing protein [Verrucomicrobiota bacterium]